MMIAETEIREAEDRLVSAMKTANLAELESLIHDSALFVTPQGHTINKQIDLDTYRSGALEILELEPVIESINLIGDNAVVSVIQTINGRFQGEAFGGNFRYVRVWKKVGGNWKIIGGAGVFC